MTRGLKYFGKTTQDPFKYDGSGTYWLRHLSVHGKNLATEIVGTYDDFTDLQKAAIQFSIDNSIVESKEWANLVIENGIGYSVKGIKRKPFTKEHREKIGLAGRNRHHTDETKQKMSESHAGMNTWSAGRQHTEETKQKMSDSQKRQSKERSERMSKWNAERVENQTHNWIGDGSFQRDLNLKRMSEGTHNFKGKVWVTNGEKSMMIYSNDPMPDGFRRGRTIGRKRP